jgi:regulator of sigma E protease
MHEFLVSAAAFIVLVGLIVILHELGHFIVAKLCGIRVEAFSFGFGPRLFGFKYGDTEYKVCLLPLGGFVKMTGENLTEESADEIASDPAAFTSHPRWQRMLIGLAGPVVNFLLALVLMFFYYALFNEVPSVTVKDTVVEWVTPGSAAAEAGIQTGDIVRGFGDINNPTWEPQVYEQIKLSPGQYVPVVVDRGGQTLTLSLDVPMAAKADDFDIGDTGMQPQYLPGPIQVAQVQPGTPAEQAGLRGGDQIEAVDGHAFHSTNTLLAYMQWEQGKPMTITLLRNGATVQITATPAKTDTRWMLGFAPQPVPIRDQPLPFLAASKKSLVFFRNNSMIVAEVLNRLFTHRLSVSQLMGPVGIARAAGEAAEMDGWMPKFGLASMISLQLGILNLMPFPILDGGMILLLLIESVLRHDISLVIKERIYTAAFVVLMAFFAFVLFNDVSRLGLFAHIKP